MAHATLNADCSLEARIQAIGRRLIDGEKQNVAHTENRWLEWFLDKVMANEHFKIQALRFIDVLPTLTDDGELHRHLIEYFDRDDLDIPALLRWGIKRKGLSQQITVNIVRKLMLQFSHFYMAGATPVDAFRTVLELRRKGLGFSLDLLGESVISEDEAQAYQQKYLVLIPQMFSGLVSGINKTSATCAHPFPQPNFHISLKVSSLYSQITPLDFKSSYQGIASRLRPIFSAARKSHVGVCLDMEQYDYKNLVIKCFKKILMESEFRDWGDGGIAIQAYLKESRADLEDLVEWSRHRGCPITIRLVRGAYWDYETIIAEQHGWDIPVWQDKKQCDQNYESCLQFLISNQGVVKTAVATHNIRSIAAAMALAESHDLANDQFEFQMLYGMARSLHTLIPAFGYPLRLYVPFGEPLPGMAYLVRRLLENSTSQSFAHLKHLRPDSEDLLSPPGTELSPSRQGINRANQDLRKPGHFKNEPLYRFIESSQRNDFSETLAGAERALGKTYPMIVNGKAINNGKYIESYNPAHRHLLVGRVACADESHANAAIEGASSAFIKWSHAGYEYRAAILQKAARLLRHRRMTFSALEIFEAGKTWREADANVTEAIDFLDFYAKEAKRILTKNYNQFPGEENSYSYRPRGVGVIIPPWNFPLAILTGMLSAAIVSGNTVILKPSSLTPIIAAKFVELLRECGMPPGVVQFLPGPGRSVGEYLVAHPKVQFVAFTGSREVGTRIIEMTSKLTPGQHHIKKVIAEMGGKNAIIVDNDADLDEAVPGVLKSAFGYQGQKCSACSRVIVVEPLSKLFIKRLLAAVRSFRVGYPEDPSVFMGPVIDANAKTRILRTIENGRRNANLVLESDCSHLKEGHFIGPTIFNDVNPNSALGQNEIFGPVLSVMTAKNFDHAIEIANDTPYALTGGLYSRSPEHIEKAKRYFEVGNLYINRVITGAMVDRQPFGGFKLSGIGSKAGGRDYLQQFLHAGTVTENTLRRGFAPQSS